MHWEVEYVVCIGRCECVVCIGRCECVVYIGRCGYKECVLEVVNSLVWCAFIRKALGGVHY